MAGVMPAMLPTIYEVFVYAGHAIPEIAQQLKVPITLTVCQRQAAWDATLVVMHDQPFTLSRTFPRQQGLCGPANVWSGITRDSRGRDVWCEVKFFEDAVDGRYAVGDVRGWVRLKRV